jgi:hypothetical protein
VKEAVANVLTTAKLRGENLVAHLMKEVTRLTRELEQAKRPAASWDYMYVPASLRIRLNLPEVVWFFVDGDDGAPIYLSYDRPLRARVIT